MSFCKNKKGERFYTERTSTMVKDEEGKPVRIEGIIRDITERKRQETELQREIQELKKKLKAIKK
ncbi:MAG: PAS domain S-box protein [Planctomycetota bacterium]